MKNYELLSPAGDIKSAYAAISAGCDALYVGGIKYSARAYATNFTEDELVELISYAHLFNVKIYMTVNTLFKEKELEDLEAFIKPYYDNGLDGVIMQDLGAITLISRSYPDLEIHASTQLTVTTSNEVNFLEQIGVTRVVLARELSLSEIKQISDDTNIELEVFIHGALCYSYSGRCLMSSMLGGRSANRGRCAGTCRLYYRCNNKEGYLLSMRDMQTLEDIDKLIHAGAYSLKIEGRMKKPEYTAGVTSIYKKYLDSDDNSEELKAKGGLVSKSDLNKINSLYIRGNKSTSYLFKHNDKSMVTIDNPSYTSNTNKEFEKIKENYVDKKLKIFLNGTITFKLGEFVKLEIFVKDSRYNDKNFGKPFTYYSEYKCEMASKHSIENEDIKKCILSTGNTNFEFNSLNIIIDKNIFVPQSILKELRRNALNDIQNKLLDNYNKTFRKKSIIKNKEFINILDNKTTLNYDTFVEKVTKYSASIESFMQFEPIYEYKKIKTLYISYKLYYQDRTKLANIISKWKSSETRKVYISLPYILRQKDTTKFIKLIEELQKLDIDGFLCRDISEKLIIDEQNLKKNYACIADATIYTLNSLSDIFVKNVLGFNKSTFSYEAHKKDLTNKNSDNDELIIYGRVPLMVSANCLENTTNKCDKKNNEIKIIDRKDISFFVHKHCNFCYNVIYNAYPNCLFNYLNEINDLNVNNYRFSFTSENEKEVDNVLDVYFNKKETNFKYTLAHFKKGIE